MEFSSEVAATLQLPQKYLAIAGANSLAGVSIGLFALWPSFVREPLERSLINSNAPGSPVRSFGDDSLIAVARYEANLICVGSAASDVPDQVFWLDTLSSPDWRLKFIAKDFEQFLVLAANVHRLSNFYENDIEGGKKKMEYCCDAFYCTPEQNIFWQIRMAEMLG